MAYDTDTAKWNAYQFNDPFASDKFLVCNKSTMICCRPNCDLSLQTSLKTEVIFAADVAEAEKAGFVRCPHCLISDADSNDLNTISIDVDLLVETVAAVNALIGFVPPVEDGNAPDAAATAARELAVRRCKARRGSVPLMHLNSAVDTTKNTALVIAKNDTDHLRLVELACRHIALAAASTLVQIHEDQTNVHRKELRLRELELLHNAAGGNRKRRRRGGVLGFKELLSKSKLSPWHFHRVFKSVTGLTPKVYGDKCWEFVRKYVEEHGSFVSRKSITISTSITNPTASPPDEHTTGVNTMRLAKARDQSNAAAHEGMLLSPPDSVGAELRSNGTLTSSRTLSTHSMAENQLPTLGAELMAPFSKLLLLDYPLDSFLDAELPGLTNVQLLPSLNNSNNLTNTYSTNIFEQMLPQTVSPTFLADTKPPPAADMGNLMLDLSDVGMENGTAALQDWNFLQAQNSSSNSKLFTLPEFSFALTPDGFGHSNSNKNLYNTTNLASSNQFLLQERATSDVGDYVQTPFNVELGNFGYFGELNSFDPLET